MGLQEGTTPADQKEETLRVRGTTDCQRKPGTEKSQRIAPCEATSGLASGDWELPLRRRRLIKVISRGEPWAELRLWKSHEL